jgi:hypothetical protein
MALPRYSSKELTKHLRALAMEAESLADSGETITKAEALSRLLWKKALGYTAMEMRGEADKRVMTEVYHPPESWAIQMIYERLEGKVPQSAVDDAGKTTAAERVSDLARTRINMLAGAPVTPDGKPAPPKPPRLLNLDRLPKPKPE